MEKIIFILFCLLNITTAFIDFYINQNETYALLGYSGALYYIYNGKLRQNTQSQILNISQDKNSIQYSWKAYQRFVAYKIHLNSSNEKNLELKSNIPLDGVVPLELSNFILNINCTKLSANSHQNGIHIQLSISFSSKKFNKNQEVKLNYLKFCKNDGKSTNTNDFLIAYLSIGILFASLIIFFLFCCLLKKFRTKSSLINIRYYYKIIRGRKPLLNKINQNLNNESINSKSINTNFESNYNRLITNTSKLKQLNNRNLNSNQNIYETLKDLTCVSTNLNQTSATTTTIGVSISTTPVNHDECKIIYSKPVKKRESRFKVNYDQIQIGSLILEGTFGKIYEGTLRKPLDTQKKQSTSLSGSSSTLNENEDENLIKVIIKTVNDLASTKQSDLMITESCALKNVKHKHVNSLVGICVEPDRQPLTLFTYCELGNMKIYLKNAHNELKSQSLSTQELLYMGLQLCKAVNFMHSKRIIHKDIATRNCWLDKNLFVKLADNALSRDIFPNDYHCLGDNENRPIMWLAYESLRENKFSIQSDLWSLGVTIWEILSFARQPYEDIDPFDMETYLENDENRLEKPFNCPKELYEIYSKCWLLDASLRPTLKELFKEMLDFYSTLGNYV